MKYINEHKYVISCIRVLNTSIGKRIVSASYDGIIHIWNPDTNSVDITFQGVSGRITNIIFVDNKIVTGHSSSNIMVWSSDGKLLQNIKNKHRIFSYVIIYKICFRYYTRNGIKNMECKYYDYRIKTGGHTDNIYAMSIYLMDV